MNTLPFANAPRCSATSKRTGQPCRAPAVKGCKVCRFHGARGGAPKGKANGRYRHGRYTQSAVAERRAVAELIRQANWLADTMTAERCGGQSDGG